MASQQPIGYCRVSTEQQGESGAGLEAQRAVIAAEFARRGVELTDERLYVDVASGKTTKRRPRLAAALLELEAGHADALVVAKLDRLSRSLLDFAGLMATAREQGWGITALDIGVDTSTVNGELVANIIMSLAQWERRIIGQRTKDALQAVKARGTQLGRPANVSNDTIELIRLLRTNGRGWLAIANVLNADNVPTAQGGAQWYASTVRAVHQRAQAMAATGEVTRPRT